MAAPKRREREDDETAETLLPKTILGNCGLCGASAKCPYTCLHARVAIFKIKNVFFFFFFFSFFFISGLCVCALGFHQTPFNQLIRERTSTLQLIYKLPTDE